MMTDQLFQPPVAKIVPYTFERHGHTLVDHYAWLQNKDDPQAIYKSPTGTQPNGLPSCGPINRTTTNYFW
jgi:hypothetical protein